MFALGSDEDMASSAERYVDAKQETKEKYTIK